MSAPMIHRSYHAPIPVAPAPGVDGARRVRPRRLRCGPAQPARDPVARASRHTVAGAASQPRDRVRRQRAPALASSPANRRGGKCGACLRPSAFGGGHPRGAALAGLVWVFALVGGDYGQPRHPRRSRRRWCTSEAVKH